MKTLKYIVPFLCVLGSTMSLMAEDSIVNRNITVEREYKPVIQDAGKIKSTPKILEPKVEKITPTYSNFNLPLNADYNIHALPAADLQRDKQAETNGGFARLGIGNYLNTLADFAYPLVKTSDIRLDFSLNHLGTFGTKAHSTTKAALSFDKYFDNFDLYAGLGGGHEYLKYYGNDFNRNDSIIDLAKLAATHGSNATYTEQNLNNIKRTAQSFKLSDLANDSISNSNTFWRFNAFAGVRSLPTADELRYQAEMQFKSFSAINGIVENQVHSKVGFNTQIDDNRWGVDVEMYNMSYKSNIPATLNYTDAYTVIGMNPYYSIERPLYNVRLGLKSSISFVHGRAFSPSFDIRGEWKAIPKTLALYGGITGAYAVNTMDEMFTENRYLFADARVEDTYTPSEVYVGIKLKPIQNLLIDAFIHHSQIDNQYFFVNKGYTAATVMGADSMLYTNRFNVLYSGASHTQIGIRANYNLRNIVNVELKGAYNAWQVNSSQYAWNKPKWEADLNTNVQITREFSVSANVYYERDRYAKLGSLAIPMNPKLDINLGASYSYNEWMTAFAKINNLINNKYQDFYGYEVQGFNALVGVAFSF